MASRTDALAAYFRRRPNAWVSAIELTQIAGLLAWRSRISDLRHAPYGLTIENRLRRVQRTDGTRVSVSEYRYVPRPAPECPASAWELRP